LNAKKNYQLPLSELRKLQDRKVKRLMHYVYDNIPFYHDIFRSQGLFPEDICGVKDLKRLPTLTKGDIQTNFPKGIFTYDKKVKGGIKKQEIKKDLKWKTSGTTGSPLTMLYDMKYCDITVALELRKNWMTGVKLLDRMAKILYFGPEGDYKNPSDDSDYTRLHKLLVGPYTTLQAGLRVKTFGLRPNNLKEIAHELYELKPTTVYSRPSYFSKLAQFYKDEDLHPRIQKLFCSGEFLSEGCKKDLINFYEADVYNEYGANEFWTLGCECQQHTGIHLNSDYHIFEFLDVNDTVSPGEEGEVVITCLHNYTMPLVRYRLGDKAVPEKEERCNCGSCLLRLQTSQGRLNDGLMAKDNCRIPPGKIINYVESVIGLRNYQIIQEDLQQILVKLNLQSRNIELKEELSNYLRNVLNLDLTLEIESYEEDELPIKHRPVISKVL
jgi:phenylacetate-CoA ligase